MQRLYQLNTILYIYLPLPFPGQWRLKTNKVHSGTSRGVAFMLSRGKWVLLLRFFFLFLWSNIDPLDQEVIRADCINCTWRGSFVLLSFLLCFNYFLNQRCAMCQNNQSNSDGVQLKICKTKKIRNRLQRLINEGCCFFSTSLAQAKDAPLTLTQCIMGRSSAHTPM